VGAEPDTALARLHARALPHAPPGDPRHRGRRSRAFDLGHLHLPPGHQRDRAARYLPEHGGRPAGVPAPGAGSAGAVLRPGRRPRRASGPRGVPVAAGSKRPSGAARCRDRRGKRARHPCRPRVVEDPPPFTRAGRAPGGGTSAMTPSILELHDITKQYDSNRVLKGVSLAVRPGTIHAVVGENGAGKSTLMNVLFGMPVIHETGGYGGRIVLAGREVRFGAPSEAMAAGL